MLIIIPAIWKLFRFSLCVWLTHKRNDTFDHRIGSLNNVALRAPAAVGMVTIQSAPKNVLNKTNLLERMLFMFRSLFAINRSCVIFFRLIVRGCFDYSVCSPWTTTLCCGVFCIPLGVLILCSPVPSRPSPLIESPPRCWRYKEKVLP